MRITGLAVATFSHTSDDALWMWEPLKQKVIQPSRSQKLWQLSQGLDLVKKHLSHYRARFNMILSETFKNYSRVNILEIPASEFPYDRTRTAIKGES